MTIEIIECPSCKRLVGAESWVCGKSHIVTSAGGQQVTKWATDEYQCKNCGQVLEVVGMTDEDFKKNSEYNKKLNLFFLP